MRLVQANASAHRRSWSDCKQHVLEDCLNDIVVGIAYVADAIASRRRNDEDREIRSRDEQIRSYEAYRRRAREEARVKALQELSARWHQSLELRAYLDAVRTAMASEDDAARNAKLLEWLEWADAYVTRLDPLASGVDVPNDASW